MVAHIDVQTPDSLNATRGFHCNRTKRFTRKKGQSVFGPLCGFMALADEFTYNLIVHCNL
jgi:hypothetical protein